MAQLFAQLAAAHVQVDADAEHHEVHLLGLGVHLVQEPRHFPAADEDVVGPLDLRAKRAAPLDGARHGHHRQEGELAGGHGRDGRPQHHRTVQVHPRRRQPDPAEPPLARGLGIEVVETKLRLDDLDMMQEAFLTGTAIELLPVGSIEGFAKTWRFKPGELTNRIRGQFMKCIDNL